MNIEQSLDVQVHEKVFGFKNVPMSLNVFEMSSGAPPKYETDMVAAMEVEKKIFTMPTEIQVTYVNKLMEMRAVKFNTKNPSFEQMKQMLLRDPREICIAALYALGVEV